MFRRVHFLGRGFLLLSLIGGGKAGPPWYTTTGKLTRVGTGLQAEGLYLTLDVATDNNTCKNKQFLLFERTQPQYRETVSIVLLALAQARPIDVYHDGSCWGDAVKLAAVSLRTSP
jgi:hypothetical protein